MISDELKKTICPLPFVHLDINSFGSYSPCCETECSKTATTKNSSPEQWFFGEELQKLRDDLLSGEKPQECRKCYKREAQGLESKRQRSLNYFANGFYGSQENIFSQPEIRDVNYRFGNDCNLSCVMCSSRASTTYGKESEALGEGPMLKFSNDLNLTDEQLKKMTGLSLGGGEPSLSKKNLELLDRLLAVGNDTLSISLNSNGTLPQSPFFKKLNSFKSVYITFSVDGEGETYNLIRYPMRWEKLNKNLEKFLDEYTHFQFSIIFSINCLNATNTPEFLSWWINFNERFEGRLQAFELNEVYYPRFLAMNLITEEQTKDTIAKLCLLLEQYKFNKSYHSFIEQVIYRLKLVKEVQTAKEDNKERENFISRRMHIRQSPSSFLLREEL